MGIHQESSEDHNNAIKELENALFVFLCQITEIEKKLPRGIQDCVCGAKWALRMTIGKEMKKHGIELRHPGSRPKNKVTNPELRKRLEEIMNGR